MARLILAASVAWLVLLGGAQVRAAAHDTHTWVGGVYLAASFVCHQRPERSFASGGMQWPVCARCSGLYLSAPLGAIAALALRRRRRRADVRLVLAIAAVPTLITLLLEWPHLAGVGNHARFLAALPLGAAIAGTLAQIEM